MEGTPTPQSSPEQSASGLEEPRPGGGGEQLSVGGILRAAFDLYRKQAVNLWTIAALIVIPVQVLLGIVVRVSLSHPFAHNGTIYTSSGSLQLLGWVDVVFTFLSLIIAIGALCKCLVDAYTGHATDWRHSVGFASQHLVSLLVLAVVGCVLLAVGYVLLVIPGVYLTVAWSVAVPALVFEGLGPIAALRRSARLVRGGRWEYLGRWWATFAVLLVGIALLVGLNLLIELILSGTSSGSVDVLVVVGRIGRAISALLVYPVVAALSTVVYMDLRTREESAKRDREMADLRAREESAKRPGEMADPATPPTAVLPRRNDSGAPEDVGEFRIYESDRFALRMKVEVSMRGTEDSFYILAPHGLGRRYKRRFPLTQGGWNQMWREFAAQDPTGALNCKEEFRRQAEQAQKRAEQAALLARQREQLRQEEARKAEQAQKRAEQAALLVRRREHLRELAKLAQITDCMLVGGYRHEQLELSKSYDLYFTEDAIIVTPTISPEVLAQLRYEDVLAVRVNAPDAVTSGGGPTREGLGSGSSAEGTIVASALNALTKRTTIQSLIELQDRSRDFIFATGSETPQEISGRLLPVQAKLRQVVHERDRQRGQHAVGQDPLDRLPKLADLHKQGVLTDDEFDAAKRELLKKL